MKIDFEMLEKLEAAGASAKVVIAVLRSEDQRQAEERKKVAMRQALRRTAGPITYELRIAVYERDKWECVYCGFDMDLTCDHVVAVKKGGMTTFENLVTACRRCNARKQDSDRKTFERRLENEGTSKPVRRKSKDIRDATLDDTPRARLFRECVPALIALNMSESRSRSLLASWLKLTNDDDQLVTAAVMRARDQQAVDVPGFVMATLKKRTGNGHKPSAIGSAFDDLIARSEGREGEGDRHPAGPADLDLCADRR